MASKLSDWLGTSVVACLDFEATCNNDNSFPRSEMEIIEVGITLLDTTTNPYTIMNVYGDFVKPVIHTQLTEFCTELTSIQQSDVDGADSWGVVAQRISALLATLPQDIPVIWASWGEFDNKLITRECTNKRVPNPMPEMHFNLKAVDAAWRNSRKEHGLKGTVDKLGITFEGQLHRAVDDARAVAMVLQQIGPGISRSKV